MSIIALLVTIGLIWLAYWGVTTLFNIHPMGARILLVVCVIVSVLLVLAAFGLLPSGGGSVPQIG